MPNMFNIAFSFWWYLVFMVLLYIPGLLFLILYCHDFSFHLKKLLEKNNAMNFFQLFQNSIVICLHSAERFLVLKQAKNVNEYRKISEAFKLHISQYLNSQLLFFFFANWHKIIFVHCFISFDFLRYCIYFLSNFFILMEILIKNLKAI